MFTNKKWIKHSIILVLILVLVLIIFLGIVVLRKYIREEKGEYISIEEIIEKNYKDSNMQMLSKGNYYYLIDEKLLGNKEELIKFENSKYIAFDKVLKLTKGIGAEIHENFNNEINLSCITVFEYDDVYVIIVKRDWNQEIVAIYDNYGVWDFDLVGDYFYYFNVRLKDEITHVYSITAATEKKVYEIADMATINVHVME